jgi:DNA-binding NtrC family response regulator
VLVVEDEPRLRELWLRELPAMDAEAFGAPSGEEALAFLERRPVDVVLLDLAMPGMDGMTFLARLRARGDAVPVVIVTAHAALESAQEAIRLGVAGYLRKPCLLRELEEAISRAVTQRRSGPPPTPAFDSPAPTPPDAVEPLDEIERRAILDALRVHRGNRAAAARALGISRRTLYNRLHAYGAPDEPPEL